ncbi:zinc finger miz domain-containing protein 1-like protein, partial [Lasius niger]
MGLSDIPLDWVASYLSDRMQAYCKHNFYADDLQIYHHCEPSDLPNGIQRVNNDIVSIAQWATSRGLTLNSTKTQAIIFGTARYINSIKLDLLPAININEQAIKLSTSIKYLGVTVANTLSWNIHVQNVVKRIRTKLYQLKLTKHLLPNELRLRLIISLVFPHLDYCCAALTDITEQQNLQLYRAINACIRFAANVRWSEHVTPHYREFRLLKTEARR